MLSLKRLVEGEVDHIDFDITVDASDVSDDVVSGSARAKGRVEDHSGFITLEGVVEPALEVNCARCGNGFVYKTPVALKAKITDKVANDDEDEFLMMVDTSVDLEEFVFSTLVLELPTRFLCREDCRGICPKCGADLNTAPCSCDLTERDSRWDALKGFFDE